MDGRTGRGEAAPAAPQAFGRPAAAVIPPAGERRAPHAAASTPAVLDSLHEARARARANREPRTRDADSASLVVARAQTSAPFPRRILAPGDAAAMSPMKPRPVPEGEAAARSAPRHHADGVAAPAGATPCQPLRAADGLYSTLPEAAEVQAARLQGAAHCDRHDAPCAARCLFGPELPAVRAAPAAVKHEDAAAALLPDVTVNAFDAPLVGPRGAATPSAGVTAGDKGGAAPRAAAVEAYHATIKQEDAPTRAALAAVASPAPQPGTKRPKREAPSDNGSGSDAEDTMSLAERARKLARVAAAAQPRAASGIHELAVYAAQAPTPVPSCSWSPDAAMDFGADGADGTDSGATEAGMALVAAPAGTATVEEAFGQLQAVALQKSAERLAAQAEAAAAQAQADAAQAKADAAAAEEAKVLAALAAQERWRLAQEQVADQEAIHRAVAAQAVSHRAEASQLKALARQAKRLAAETKAQAATEAAKVQAALQVAAAEKEAALAAQAALYL
jgi:hypothetical protein